MLFKKLNSEAGYGYKKNEIFGFPESSLVGLSPDKKNDVVYYICTDIIDSASKSIGKFLANISNLANVVRT